MTNRRSNLRSWFSRTDDQPAAEAVEETIDHRFEPDEQLVYHLPGKAGVVHESGREREEISPADDGGSFLAITNRKLLFAVATADGEEVIELPLIDLRDAEIDEGLLTTVLSIEIWDHGTYRFRPARSDDLEEIVEYLEAVSDCWQIVDTLLDDFHVTASEVGDHIEAGRLDEAKVALEEARTTLRKAGGQIQTPDIEAVLVPRIEDAERELHRTRMRARLARAKTLTTEAKHQTDAGVYTGAYKRYQRARHHLETALGIANEHGFDEPPIIQSGIDTIDQRIENLRVLPMALARQARERAEGTNKLSVEVDTLEQAFEHYHDALTAGWGTDIEFAGADEDLRFSVEVAVANLINAKQEYAAQLEAEGDENREQQNPENAAYRYEKAIEQLEEARQLAREFNAGDPEEVGDEHGRLAEKLESVT